MILATILIFLAAAAFALLLRLGYRPCRLLMAVATFLTPRRSPA